MPKLNTPEALKLAEPYLDQICEKISAGDRSGLSRNGNMITLRWNTWDKQLVDVTLVAIACTTPDESSARHQHYEARQKRINERNARILKDSGGVIDLEAEMYYIEYGEWPK